MIMSTVSGIKSIREKEGNIILGKEGRE